MLTRSEIEEILRLIEGSDFAELRLEMGDLKLEVRRKGASPAPLAAPPAAPTPTAPAPASPAEPPALAVPAPAEGEVEVPAPLLGTFWHAPRPGAPPFVRPGDAVTAETVIGIVEVMKLMTSVEAGVAGTVTAILAPNGGLVEHGAALVRIRPA